MPAKRSSRSSSSRRSSKGGSRTRKKGSRTARSRRSASRAPLLSPQLQRTLAAFFILGVGLIGLLSLFSTPDTLLWGLREGLRMAFGWLTPLVLLAILAVGAYFVLGEARGGVPPEVLPRILGGLLLWLALEGLLHLFFGPGLARLVAEEGRGGGYVGYGLALLVRAVFGVWAGGIVLLLLLLSGFVLLSGLSLQDLGRILPRLLEGARQARTRARALRRPEVKINLPANGNGAAPRSEPAEPPPPPEPEPPRTLRVERTPAKPAPTKPDRPSRTKEAAEPAPPSLGTPPARRPAGWQLPPLDLLQGGGEAEISQEEIRQKVRIIEETLATFGVEAHVVEVNCGPAVTQFAVQPGTGVKVNRITSLKNDLALALAARSIRIEAPVPGRPYVGIEIPNSSTTLVTLRDMLESPEFQRARGILKMPLGRSVSGAPVIVDLAALPHLLIAGATGSGKSVAINVMVSAFLYQHTPDTLRLLMIDPKMVELTSFNGVPHLLAPVVVDVEKVIRSLRWAVREMERRYRVFAKAGARNIQVYNRKAAADPELEPLPYIVVIIDELADLMMAASDEVETLVVRLAQLARATGIHLVIATQRPSVDVVTGLIKANFPARVAFAVSSQVDSRVILDMAGAEQLLGRGDMLFLSPNAAKPRRIQGTFISDEELEALVSFWRRQVREEEGETRPPAQPLEGAQLPLWEEIARDRPAVDPDQELKEKAIELARRHGRISVSMLQRRLRIGYNRAARIVEELEAEGKLRTSEDGRFRVPAPEPSAEGSGPEGEGSPPPASG